MRVLFFDNSEEFGQKVILGQPPSGVVDLFDPINQAEETVFCGSNGKDPLATNLRVLYKEEFPAWSYNISETWVRGMMAAMYRRFFKDPGTFEPSNETIGGDIVEAALDSLIGKTEKPKNKSGL